jgi:putative flippase GtrA
MASIVDLGISNYLYGMMQINYLIACNVGIVVGFLFQYFTGMKYIFKEGNRSKSFAIYLGTFAIGLLLATVTMWISYEILFLSFLHSKLMSMLVPFFITYVIRKALLGTKNVAKKTYHYKIS